MMMLLKMTSSLPIFSVPYHFFYRYFASFTLSLSLSLSSFLPRPAFARFQTNFNGIPRKIFAVFSLVFFSTFYQHTFAAKFRYVVDRKRGEHQANKVFFSLVLLVGSVHLLLLRLYSKQPERTVPAAQYSTLFFAALLIIYFNNSAKVAWKWKNGGDDDDDDGGVRSFFLLFFFVSFDVVVFFLVFSQKILSCRFGLCGVLCGGGLKCGGSTTRDIELFSRTLSFHGTQT